MPLLRRTTSLALVAGALLFLPRPGPAGGPALGKPVRLGQPAPVPKLPGLPNRPSIAFSADGKRLAWVFTESITDDAKGLVKEGGLLINVWDVAKRKLLKELRAKDNLSLACSPLRFFPDGERLVLGTYRSQRKDNSGTDTYNKIRFWDVDVEQESGELKTEDGNTEDAPLNLYVHPKGDRLTVVHARGGHVVEIASGEVSDKFSTDAPTAAPVLSPDCKLLAGAVKGEGFRLWRTSDGKELHRLAGQSLAFSSDSRTVASQHEGKIKLWDVQNGKLERELPGKTDPQGRWFAFSRDGKLLAWNDAGKVTVADRATGKALATVAAQPGPLAFAPDGDTLALACPDSTALLWDLRPLRKAK
jgi:WD40 repeat protein